MKELKDLNDKKALAIIAVLTVVLLSIPLVIRILAADSYPLGYDSYKSLLHSQMFIDDPSLTKDGGIVFTLYDIAVGLLSSVIGLNTVLLVLPFIFGIISVILVYLVLRWMKTDRTERFIITLLLVISPAFFYTFSTSNPVALSFFLNIAGFYFITKKKKIFFFLSLLIYSMMPFLGVFPFLTSILPVIYYHRKNIRHLTVLILSSVIFIARIGWILYTLGIPKFRASFDGALFSYYISDLGVSAGFGVFLAFLFFVGLFLSLKEKKKFIPGYAYLFFLIIFSLFDSSLFIFLCLPVSFFAGFGVSRIFTRKWQLPYIRYFSLVLLICGFLFSTASFTNYLIGEGPSLEEIESLKWLNDFSRPGGVVLTGPSYGFMVEAVSKKQALSKDGLNYFLDDSLQKNNTHTLFNSRNLENTKAILADSNIEFIWITPKMKSEIWGKKEDGLLFLFRNNETFKKSNHDTSIEIWELKLPRDER